QMRQMHKEIQRYCERELVKVACYTVLGDDLTLYLRPSFRLEGDSRGWVTRDGLTLFSSPAYLRKRNKAHLEGRIDLNLLKRVPGVAVTLKAGGKEQKIPARFDVTDGRYRLDFQVPTERLPREGEVTIDIKFDTWFVPRDLGLNDDVRELTVNT